jgi:imidazoleglycerol-phosphate dehydratase
MLELFGRHSLFDLQVEASGDVEVDYHHTVEDIGITLGEAIGEALGAREGIARYGTATVPMDEALASVSVDLGGRPYLVINLFGQGEEGPDRYSSKAGEFDLNLLEVFFTAVAQKLRANLHINLHYGTDPHHIAEAVFKAWARALLEATRVNPRVQGVLSTKGII